MLNFWKKLNKPIYALAPMAGISDSAFRQMCKQFGAQVVYSEMASVNALKFAPAKTLDMLKFSQIERPYVVQLFGSEPKHFALATKLVSREIKPDGIDINFGCPVAKVQKQGAGVVLMNKPQVAREIIKATISATDLPVSIKTRAQVSEVDVLKFLDIVNGSGFKALMIHGRTMKQGFKGPIDTEMIKNARDYFDGVILANGGVYNYEDAQVVLNKTKADGIGIAQGSLGRPWIFKAVRTGQSVERSPKAVFKVARQHAELAQETKGEVGIKEMRKHLGWYAQGLPGAKKLRSKIVQIETLKDIRTIFSEYSE